MNKIVQAKAISDAMVLDAIRAYRGRNGVPKRATTWDIITHLSAYPAPVVMAKLGSLLKRGFD